MTDSAPSHSTDAVIVTRLRRLMCVFTGLLVAATWPLWIPGPEFPDIPWLESFRSLREDSFDWIFVLGLAVCLVMEFRGLDRNLIRTRFIRGICLIPLIFVLIPDQHRLQPWVFQMLMMATLLTIPQERTAVYCLRLFTISIYVHSALSKFDMAFVDSHGQWLLDGLTTSLGMSTEFWSETTRQVLAGMFPIGELLTALLLLWPRTRRMGLKLAILMHVILLLALGPLGYGHHAGVLIWNVYFILMDVLIFRDPFPGEDASTKLNDGEQGCWSPVGPRKVENGIAWGVTTIFALLPCLSWWGLWDHWPSWAVYSSRPAIVEVFVPEGDIERLPKTLQPFVGPPAPLSDRCPVNLDAWSFSTLWCPMYPQERYRVAVAAAIGDLNGIEDMRVIIRSSPDRWTGNRQVTTLEGLHAIRERADGFWLNTHARR